MNERGGFIPDEARFVGKEDLPAQNSVRKPGIHERWKEIMLAAGLGLSMVHGAEARELDGEMQIKMERGVEISAVGHVGRLIPELSTVNTVGTKERVMSSTNIDFNMSLQEFYRKMDQQRNHEEAVDTFKRATQIIKQEIIDPKLENKIIVELGLECDEGIAAVTGNESKTSAGEIKTAGDLVKFFAEFGKRICTIAYTDSGDMKKSTDLTSKTMYAAEKWIGESDPSKSTYEIVKGLVHFK